MEPDRRAAGSFSSHARVRCQQRGIPAIVTRALEQFGDRSYDGHGAIIMSFTKRSFKRMQRARGHNFASKLEKWKNVYKVESVNDRVTITVGHRTKRIRRK